MQKICDYNSQEIQETATELREKDILIMKLNQKLSERSHAEELELVVQKEKL